MSRHTITAPAPNTNTVRTTPLRVRRAMENYQLELRGYPYIIDTDSFEFRPQSFGRGEEYSRFNFEVGDEAWFYRENSTWTLDKADTGVDTDNKTAGLVDGITFGSDVDYLYWAFLDSNFQFAGLGITRKPYSAFTAIGGDGTAALGEAGVSFTVTNGYQFTVGAEVVARNTVGTAPLYEYNWGTITAVANTSVTLDMFNNSNFGTAITGTTGGEILQWNEFRPWVVTSSSQTLYSSYYCLLGEIQTVGSDVRTVYRADEPWRGLFYTFVDDSASTLNGTMTTIARWIPYWATRADIRFFLNGGVLVPVAGQGWGIREPHNGLVDFIVPVTAQDCRWSATVDLWVDAQLQISSSISATARKGLQVQTYYVNGGMQG